MIAAVMQMSRRGYLVIAGILVVLCVLLPVLLWVQQFNTAASVVAMAGALAVVGWAVIGVLRWYEIPWVRRIWSYVLGLVLFYLAFNAFQLLGWPGMATAVLGALAMTVCFVAGIWLIRLILTPAFTVTAVARTLVEEAIRMRIAVVFMVIMLMIVPVLPWVLDPTDFLKDRMQTFLTWSFVAVTVFLSLMTIFLAVGTITQEIRSKRIFLTMTKPVGRGSYLLGKWLGIVLLNGVMLSVCLTGIYAFTKVLEQEKYTMHPLNADRVAVDEQVLVARQAVRPLPAVAGGMQALYEARLQMLRDQDPDRYTQISAAERLAIMQEAHRQWYQIGPRMVQAYRFSGLADVRERDFQVQLRLQPRAGEDTDDGRVELLIRINGRPFPHDRPLDRLSTDTTHVLNIPTFYISEDGEMTIEIANPTVDGQDQPTISFNATDGIEMLYRVGGFEANLVRAGLIIWFMQMFLAMLGLVSGSFLSFPVASVMSLMVFVTSLASGFINESFQYFSKQPAGGLSTFESIIWPPLTIVTLWAQGEIWEGIKIIAMLLGKGFMLMMPSIARFDPTALINSGQWVSPSMVIGSAIWVGLVATGLLGLLGWAIFRGRELAKVTV